MRGTRKPAQPKAAAGTPTDTLLRTFLGYRLRRASNVIQADLAATLKTFDLRMITFTALVLVRENPGLSQSQLAAATDIERPNLVVIVDELETRGLITRDRLLTDRRTYALAVTEAGNRLCVNAIAAVNAHEKRLFDGLSNADRQTIEAAMSLLDRNARG